MSVQRGNAASIMGSHGPQRKLEKCFDIILQDEKVIKCTVVRPTL